jgi:hypothetical protein
MAALAVALESALVLVLATGHGRRARREKGGSSGLGDRARRRGRLPCQTMSSA